MNLKLNLNKKDEEWEEENSSSFKASDVKERKKFKLKIDEKNDVGSDVESEELRYYLKDVYFTMELLKYAKTHFNEENVTFWLGVEAFKTLFSYKNKQQGSQGKTIEGLCKNILNSFILEGSPFEINITNAQRYVLKRRITSQQYYKSLFEEIQNDIFNLIRDGVYRQFKKTSEYQKAIEKHQEKRNSKKGKKGKKVNLINQDNLMESREEILGPNDNSLLHKFLTILYFLNLQ